MTLGRALFSSATGSWATPTDLYAALDAEFGFTMDPCPLGGADLVVVGPVGSRSDYLVMHRDERLGVRMTTGCFSGSWGEFRAAVERTHPPGSRYRQEYEWCGAAAYATLTARTCNQRTT